MGLLTPGYWPSTYWAKDYWAKDYWPDYGLVEVQAVYSKIAIKAAYPTELDAKRLITAGIAANYHIVTTLLAKEEQ